VADDIDSELMPLLANISEVPSVTVSDDPFSRFISLRNSSAAATAPTHPTSVNYTALPGQYFLPTLRVSIHKLSFVAGFSVLLSFWLLLALSFFSYVFMQYKITYY